MITFSKQRRLGFVTILALALFALAPSRSSAQFPPDVHIFLGERATVTVDGQPIAADAIIEAIDEDGMVVATAITTDGLWSIQVDAVVGAIRFRVGTDVSDLFPVISGEVTEVPALELGVAPLPTTRSVQLRSGFNLVGWTGPTTPIGDALEGMTGTVISVFAWDSAAQTFLQYRPGVPAALNTLTELETADGVWVLMDRAGSWTMEDLRETRSLFVDQDFNLVAWTGPDHTPIADAFDEAIIDNLVTVYFWDAPAGRFRSYGPSRLAVLNDLDELNHGDAVWLLMSQYDLWNQPAP